MVGRVGDGGGLRLGTLGGALVGRDGICGGAPNTSLLLGKGGNGPGRNGTGGAPEWGPGEGMAGAGPRPDEGRAGGALSVGLLWVVGLGGGDLRECCIQESSTGGGAGVNVVDVLMSPMITRASLMAWYIRSISSRRWACSADSSMRVFWSSDE